MRAISIACSGSIARVAAVAPARERLGVRDVTEPDR